MKLDEALKIIRDGLESPGYIVVFEWMRGRKLQKDHFPEQDEGKLIPTEEEAWDLARQFATKTAGKCVNIYVVRGDTMVPVEGYRDHMIKNWYFGD